MMNSLRLYLLILMGCFASLSVFADGNTVAAESQKVSVADRQISVQEKIRRLEDRMVRLSKLLAETDPTKSDRLKDGLDLIGEKQLRGRLMKVTELLQNNQFGDAEYEQQAAIEDLGLLLELLRSTQPGLDELRKERERLEKYRQALQDVFDAQAKLRADLNEREQLQDAAEQLAAMAEHLRNLADQQASVGDNLQQQQSVAEKVKDAGDSSRRLADDPKFPADNGVMNQAAEKAEDAGDEAKLAAEKMSSAAEDAQKHQQATGRLLREAADALERESAKLKEKADIRRIERLQRELQREVGDVVRDMKASGRDGDRTPGRKASERASDNMRQAGDDLGDQKTEPASDQQMRALAELDSAINELDDAIRQVRREEMEEALAGLEARFKQILMAEQDIRLSMKLLLDKGVDTWERLDHMRLEELAVKHDQTIEDANAALRVLEDEGTTVVLPDLTRLLISDMEEARSALKKESFSSDGIEDFDAIIDQLEEILAAIAWQREEGIDASMNSGGGGGQGGDAPLMAPSAELKLLRLAQVKVNDQTNMLSQREADGETVSAAKCQRLAHRQRRLVEMTQKMMQRR